MIDTEGPLANGYVARYADAADLMKGIHEVLTAAAKEMKIAL